MEVRCVGRSGDIRWGHVRAVREPGRGGRPDPAMATAMIEDITERKRAEHALIRRAELNERQALHDPLTGLPNRLLFGRRIERAVKDARRSRTHLAVALMDLDRFKEVNDSLGHEAGDQLLVEVSRRMRDVMRVSDTVARLGGDEFGLLLPRLGSGEAAVPVLERIRAALQRPMHVHALPLAVECSIGVAVFPGHGAGAQALIQHADVAMYDAKRDNLPFAFYDEVDHRHALGGPTLVSDLRQAMQRHELVLHYQPKLTLASGQTQSVEALLRWAHPRRGLVHPDAFIPAVREAGLIGPLASYVIDEALRQTQKWHEAGLTLSVSVNLAVRNLLDPDFPHQVAVLLARHRVPAQTLALEVTESAMLANPRRAQATLTTLAGLGVRLSIDDYGTGYSALADLRQLRVDEIKIDRSFVTGMAEQPDNAVIVRSIVDLGLNLGLDVVAEGVETAEVLGRLRQLGCRMAQGYVISPPLPAEELTGWLRSGAAPEVAGLAGAASAAAGAAPAVAGA